MGGGGGGGGGGGIPPLKECLIYSCTLLTHEESVQFTAAYYWCSIYTCSLLAHDVKVVNLQLHITGTEYLCLDINILLENSFLI